MGQRISIISMKDVDILRNKERIILIRDNRWIYDVTEFENHPGGRNILIESVNGDVQKSYNFHCKMAKVIWTTHLIGELKK